MSNRTDDGETAGSSGRMALDLAEFWSHTIQHGGSATAVNAYIREIELPPEPIRGRVLRLRDWAIQAAEMLAASDAVESATGHHGVSERVARLAASELTGLDQCLVAELCHALATGEPVPTVAGTQLCGFLVYGDRHGEVVRLELELVDRQAVPIYPDPAVHWLTVIADDFAEAVEQALAAVTTVWKLVIPPQYSIRWRLRRFGVQRDTPLLAIKGPSMGLSFALAIAHLLARQKSAGRGVVSQLADLQIDGIGASASVSADGRIHPIDGEDLKSNAAEVTAAEDPMLLHAVLWSAEQVGITERPTPTAESPVSHLVAQDLRTALAKLQTSVIRDWAPFGELYTDHVFRRSRLEGFIGREWLLGDLATKLEDPQPVLLHGTWGIGKSTAMAAMATRYPDRVAVLHFCRENKNRSRDPRVLVKHIIAGLGRVDSYRRAMLRNAPDLDNDLETRSPHELLDDYVLNQAVDSEEPVWLLIDGLDEADDAILRIVEYFAHHLPSGLRLLVSCRSEDRATQVRLAKRLVAVPFDLRTQENHRDLQDYLDRELRNSDLQRALAAGGVSADVCLELLLRTCGGRFQWLKMAIDMLGMMEQIDLATLEALRPEEEGIYEAYFERVFGASTSAKLTQATVMQLCGLIAVAEEPFSLSRLQAASGLSKRQLSDFRAMFAHYLLAGEEPDPLMQFNHGSLPRWLSNPERAGSGYHVDLIEAHGRLAHACATAWTQPTHPMADYARRFLPSHLRRAERWSELYDLLISFDYWRTSANAHELFDLAGALQASHNALDKPTIWSMDLDCSEATTVLRLLEEALRRDISFLHRHPKALLSAIWRHAWWYDHPNASLHYDPPTGPWTERASLSTRYRLHVILEAWSKMHKAPWLRSLRPSSSPLNGPLKQILRGHQGTVSSVAVSGDYIISGSIDKTIKIWNPNSGKLLNTLSGHHGWVMSVAVSDDFIVSGSWDGTIRVWDARNFRHINTLTEHNDIVGSVVISGKSIVSGSSDQTIRIWDAISGECLSILEGNEGGVSCIAASNDFIVRGSWDGTVRVWDARNNQHLHDFPRQEGWVMCVAISGDRIVVGGENNVIQIWNAKTRRPPIILHGHRGPVLGVALAGDRIISGSHDKTIRIWDSVSGVCLGVLNGHNDGVCSVAFSGDHIISGSADMSLGIWDEKSKFCFQEPIGHNDDISSLAMFGDRIISTACDDMYRVWDATAGTCLHEIKAQEGSLSSLFSESILTGEVSSIPFLWDEVRFQECEDLGVRQKVTNPHWLAVFQDGGIRIRHTRGSSLEWPEVLGPMVGSEDGRLLAGGVGLHLMILSLEAGGHEACND